MKVKLKSIFGLAALGMTLLAATAPTWAGRVRHSGVYINPNYSPTLTYVSGTMVGARYSADSTQYIGCSLDTTPSVRCSAQNGANTYAYCYSYDAGHAETVQKMTDSSEISFTVNRANSTCSLIMIDAYSQ